MSQLLPPNTVVFPFESQACQYAETGAPGVTYERNAVEHLGPRAVIDCLLFRDHAGRLVGILNHYPYDIPPYESAGSVNVFVRPDRQRRGIGTALIRAAEQRWSLDPDTQRYSPAGAAFAASLGWPTPTGEEVC